MSKKISSKKYPGVYTVEGVKGKSYGITYYHPASHKRVQKIIRGCKTEKEADDFRSIEIADASRGLLHMKYDLKGSTKVISLKAAVELYRAWAEVNKKSYYVEKFKYPGLCSAFDGKLLSDITPAHIEQFKADRVKEVSKKTVNQELILLRQIYVKAAEWKKYEGQNPAKLVKNFKIPRDRKPGCFIPDEVAAIIQAIKHPVKRDMVRFAYYTGWRISEIRKLKWDAVDPVSGIAFIMSAKNGENARIVISEEVIDIIVRQPRKSEYVFCKHNGDPYRSCLNGVIRSAAKEAGITLPPRKKWHLFRRTWATTMLQQGVDIPTIMEMGNWKDASMPLWYGDSMRDGSKRSHANKIPKLKI